MSLVWLTYVYLAWSRHLLIEACQWLCIMGQYHCSCHSWRRCWMTVSWADTTGWHYNLASNKRSIMKISQTSLGMIVVHCILCDKDLLFMRHWSLLKSISSMATMTRLNQINLNDFIHSILSSSRLQARPQSWSILGPFQSINNISFQTLTSISDNETIWWHTPKYMRLRFHTSFLWAAWGWLALDVERVEGGRVHTRADPRTVWWLDIEASRSLQLWRSGELLTCSISHEENLANLIWFHCSDVSVPQETCDFCGIPPEQFHILCVSAHSIARSLTDACNFFLIVWRQCNCQCDK